MDSTTERFLSRVNKDGPVPSHRPELGPCWVWTGSANGKGYGEFSMTGRAGRTGAHRAAWTLLVGPIPPGKHVLHKCDNTTCVRPDHLLVGTPADNMRDCSAKMRTGADTHPGKAAEGLRQYVLSHPDSIKKGEANGFSKLTADDVRKADRWLKEGVTHNEIARRLKVHHGSVANIAYGRTWGHLTGRSKSNVSPAEQRAMLNAAGPALLAAALEAVDTYEWIIADHGSRLDPDGELPPRLERLKAAIKAAKGE